MDTDNEKLAQQLKGALTSEQLTDVMAQLLKRVPENERMQFCDEVAPDAGAVLRALFNPSTAIASEEEINAPTSDAKFAEEFRAALGSWHDVIMEVGDEDGKYILQERHWDPPDFDAPQVATDLEQCAEDLLPLLDRAAELELEDEALFVGLCQELSHGIDLYPEYIYTEEGVDLEQKATECVLTWLDLHANSVASFLDKLLAFMDEAGAVSLEDKTVRAYMLDRWPEKRRRALYEAIKAKRLSDDTFRRQSDKPRTLWNDILYSLAGEFDVAGQIKMAEASVSEDWTKGIGLVDAAVAEDDAVRAMKFCRKTVDAYYRKGCFGRNTTTFDPATTPLFGYWGAGDESAELVRMLKLWAELAAQNGDTELAEYLNIQKALFSAATDWPAVRAAFAQATSADTTVLYDAWKEQTLKMQQKMHVFGPRPQVPQWPEWLIDAGFADRFEEFTQKALPWLNTTINTEPRRSKCVSGQKAVFQWPPQMSLVADLFALDSSLDYPTLKTMLMQHCRLQDCQSRLEWLSRTDVASLTSAGIGFVQKNMASLVPSPARMSGDYAVAAGWLAAAREVMPDTAWNLLEQWRSDFKRCRNLWRDLREYGFDV